MENDNARIKQPTRKNAVFSGHVDTLQKNESSEILKKNERLLSLDFYRGLIMVLLMLEASGLYKHLVNASIPSSFIHSIVIQFTHHDWHGLHFWDLIQPAFMFIAGTAMAFSLTKQTSKGRPWAQQASRALKRSLWLLFWGILIYAVRGNNLSFELWNVLTQLSFTLLIAFLIFRWKTTYQILFSIGLLALTECLYRYTHIPGFDQPFTDQHNFGNYIDLILMNKINSGGWVALNAIPTAAHTIWGAVAGKWLLEKQNVKSKLGYIIIFGVVTLSTGYILDSLNITPIIKKIGTSSFTLVSGGWCLIALAILYYWIDELKHKRFLSFFTIVGMNSIFIYLFFEILVHHWLYEYSYTLVNGIISPIGIAHTAILIISSIILFSIQWYVCFWLYQKKIFFKV